MPDAKKGFQNDRNSAGPRRPFGASSVLVDSSFAAKWSYTSVDTSFCGQIEPFFISSRRAISLQATRTQGLRDQRVTSPRSLRLGSLRSSQPMRFQQGSVVGKVASTSPSPPLAHASHQPLKKSLNGDTNSNKHGQREPARAERPTRITGVAGREERDAHTLRPAEKWGCLLGGRGREAGVDDFPLNVRAVRRSIGRPPGRRRFRGTEGRGNHLGHVPKVRGLQGLLLAFAHEAVGVGKEEA